MLAATVRGTLPLIAENRGTNERKYEYERRPLHLRSRRTNLVDEASRRCTGNRN